jgi:hypothetical protein
VAKQALPLYSAFATVVFQSGEERSSRASRSKLVCYRDRGAEADAEGINNTIIGHFSHLLPQGSLSLSAEAQVFVFLARFDAKASLVALSHIDK